MTRLELFPPEEGGIRRIRLVRLSAEIAGALGGLGRVAVEGDVVAPRAHPGGTYFTLRDRVAQVGVRCPSSRAARCRVVAGERALVTASVVWLPDRGQVQLVASEVVPVGDGAIAAAVAERRERLRADGLLDRPRRALPRLPAAIGVVCGTDAAVRADIESVIAERFPGYPVAWVETAVVGPGAAEAIAAALTALDARPEVEVIVLARGGGDAAQLLPFSDEELCRAICRCSTPVVSAVGHHGDRPLCDEVADVRCATPSLAAAAVVPSRLLLEAELSALAERRRGAAERRLAEAARRVGGVDRDGAVRAGLTVADERLRQVTARAALVHPLRAVASAAARLDRLDWRAPARRRLGQERHRLAACARQLDALSPARVLDRGYAVVRAPDGTVVRRAAQVGVGEVVDVQLAAGRLAARIEETGP